MDRVDVAIVGAGLVGLATAYQINRTFPKLKIALFEKEKFVAAHQSSHNSGVIHSGMYYKPGSLKAENCRAGKTELIEFCERARIPFNICGKVIVATEEKELGRLQKIFERGSANGVRCNLIDRARLKDLEPAVEAISAIHVPEAGIVDFKCVAEALKRLLEELGASILLEQKLVKIIREPKNFILQGSNTEISARYIINCAGLYSDHVLQLTGVRQGIRIIPFRGEYYKLDKKYDSVCKSLIYPVPDPEFPFLGVHLTRMINGDVECGPNAVLGLAKEAYRKSDFQLREFLDIITNPGFLRFSMQHWRSGLQEMYRSYSKGAFVRALQRLVPALESDHLVPAPAGVRAQAIDQSGKILDDFAIYQERGMLHVLNAPSPAATSCLSIGRMILKRVMSELDAA